MAYNYDKDEDKEVDEEVHSIFEICSGEDIGKFSDDEHTNKDENEKYFEIGCSSDYQDNKNPNSNDKRDFF